MHYFRHHLILGIVLGSLIPYHAKAGINSIGPNGINSASLGLTGAGIAIGQVEPGRPGMMGFDTDSMCCNSTINPTAVFRRDQNATPDDSLRPHSLWVSGVMISTDPIAQGVATGAALYSSATDNTSSLVPEHDIVAISMQRIATAADVRAINYSAGRILDTEETLDGNSLLTQFVDWSAREHDTLYVIAGNEGPPDFPVPTDNFNGITIGASTRVDGIGVYRKVSALNDFGTDVEPVGARTATDLLAPGIQLELTGPNGAVPVPPNNSGTSFAAPHVTGTVALLQEYGDERIMNSGNPAQWNPNGNARRHEVMKAVLMNSADKLNDNNTVVFPGTTTLIPQGKLLGMERTVWKTTSTDGVPDNWFDSEAYLEEETFFFDTPLDEEMGVGHLNAKRALQQFIPGEQQISGTRFDPVSSYAAPVPLIGWDYGTVGDPNLTNNEIFPMNRYLLDGTLQAGDFISITLAWDREVEFANDADMDGEFDVGDTFADGNLLDLNLYLAPKGTPFIGDDVMLYSESEVFPVEHIFDQIPFTGEWEIWVFRNKQSNSAKDYALSWWYGLAPEIEPPDPPELLGDFDADGDADGADFLVWQRDMNVGNLADWENDFGSLSTTILGDFDNDNDVDGFDFLTWQRDTNVGSLADWESEFGMTGGPLVAASASAVPEPATGLLLLMGLGFATQFRSRRC